MIHVLLSINLHDAIPPQRELFDVEMIKRNWARHPEVDDAYWAAFPQPASEPEVVEASEIEVTQALEAAGIMDWDGMCITAEPPYDQPDVPPDFPL